jgi:protein gp37
MSETTKIEWCDSTFNPWIGCTKISPACDHCYAAALDKRTGGDHWGNVPRRRTGEHNWNEPRRWQKKAAAFLAEHGHKRRVFCASMADVFDNQVPTEWRADLWALIRDCPDLDWLLLTKRPQNINKMKPEFWEEIKGSIWLGTTVEDQTRADQNIPHLIGQDCAVRFLSCEPLLGPIDFKKVPGFNRIGVSLFGWWVIAGGESGAGARPSHPEWVRSIRDQCKIAGVPFLFKQWGNWLPGFMTPSEHAMMLDESSGDGKGMTLGAPPHAASRLHHWDDHPSYIRVSANVGKAKAGRLLHGVEHNGMPA